LLACAEEGFTVVGVEREPSYFAMAFRRLGLDEREGVVRFRAIRRSA
jgi:hypothetical protein